MQLRPLAELSADLASELRVYYTESGSDSYISGFHSNANGVDSIMFIESPEMAFAECEL